jgi:hypothetical protein
MLARSGEWTKLVQSLRSAARYGGTEVFQKALEIAKPALELGINLGCAAQTITLPIPFLIVIPPSYLDQFNPYYVPPPVT